MIAWAIEALAASALLIALVLALRGPVRRAFGATVAYALWAIPPLRLVLPPLPSDWLHDTATPLAAASEQVAMLVLPEAPVEAGPPMVGVALVALWCVGAAAFLGWQIVAYRRFTRRVAASGRALGRVGRIALVVSDAVTDPIAYGITRPVVAVPSDFRLRYGPAERELALAHEVAHHRRGDMVANCAALACLALHWFNPLAWVAFRAFRADQEMANDAHVLAGSAAGARHAYACAILKAAGCRTPAAACGLHTVEDLKGRLKMLAMPVTRGRVAAGAATVAVATALLLAVTASGSEAATAVRRTVETTTGVPLDALSPVALLQAAPVSPAPPMRPAAPAAGRGDRRVDIQRQARVVRVAVTRNGRTERFEGPAAERYIAEHPDAAPPAPPPPAAPVVATGESGRLVVSDADCRPGTGPSVVSRDEGDRRVMIVCRNRVKMMADAAMRAHNDAEFQTAMAERHAATVERQAAAIERDALASARASLTQAVASIRLARRSIQADRNLTDAQRREALDGLDEAMAEVRDQMND